jgi:hypothetical protein
MPFRTIPGTSEQYALVAFDSNGAERRDDPQGKNGLMSAAILDRVQQSKPTHVFLFSHGWKGDLESAKDQYDRWVAAMLKSPADLARMGPGFKPLWIGLHWPSLPWGEDEFANVAFAAGDDVVPPAPAELVERYVKRLDLAESDEARKLVARIVEANQQDAAADQMPADVEAAYERLAQLAGYESKGAAGPPDADGAPFRPVERFEAGNAGGVDFGGGGILGGLLGPLRQLSFWRMKKRARAVGETGMHDFVAALMRALPQARFHFMGHSFGCIVVSSILGGKDGRNKLPRAADSAVLVQGALSLWAYSQKVPDETGPGYFNALLKSGAVRGPVVTTQSTFDRAVGMCYPLAVAAVAAGASFDNSAVADAQLPKYGAIGSFGIRGVDGCQSKSMLDANGEYGFQAGKVYNVESSQFIRKGGGASGAHSDIDGPEVAHLLWQAAIV